MNRLLEFGAALPAATLCVALIAGCTGSEVERAAPAAAPADEETGLLLAYNVLDDEEKDDYEVFVMNLDGSGKRNLSNHPAVDWTYHAAGDRLYLVSDRDDAQRKYHLYSMRSDGSDLRRITDFRVRDSWLGTRAGGDELVVSSSRDGTPDLYLIDRDGTVLRRLTDDPAEDSHPAFSPDGHQVVFSSRRSGSDELWILDVGSGAIRQLTHYPEEDPAREEHAYHAGPPAWEPHRDLISFCSKRNGNSSIFTIRSDGTGLQQLTPDGTDEFYHSWSPDGRWLAYDGTDAAGNFDIYLRDMETGEVKRLTDDPTYEQGPVFVKAPG